MTKYRAIVKCDNDKCNKRYTSIAMNKIQPVRCKFCGSTMVRTLEAWPVDEETDPIKLLTTKEIKMLLSCSKGEKYKRLIREYYERTGGEKI